MTRVAIAGAAHQHVEYAIDELTRSRDSGGELELVAVSDESLETARGWAEPFGALAYSDHRRMLAEVNAEVVVVAGVYGDRGAVVVDALLAGCDVVADKPLCTTLDELDRIEDAARVSGKSVTLLLEKRYYPETLAALELVRAGELGTIVGITSSGPHKLNRSARPDWFFDRSRYGGILNDLAVHDLDAALGFIAASGGAGAGGAAASGAASGGAGASGAASGGTVHGAVTGPLDGAPGFSLYGVTTLVTPSCLVTVETNWMTPAASPVHGDYQLRIVGTEGVAELFWARKRLVVTTASEPPRDVELSPGFRPAELALLALSRGEAPDISSQQSFLATRLALLAQRTADLGEPPAYVRFQEIRAADCNTHAATSIS